MKTLLSPITWLWQRKRIIFIVLLALAGFIEINGWLEKSQASIAPIFWAGRRSRFFTPDWPDCSPSKSTAGSRPKSGLAPRQEYFGPHSI